eukprot:IDg15864t1
MEPTAANESLHPTPSRHEDPTAQLPAAQPILATATAPVYPVEPESLLGTINQVLEGEQPTHSQNSLLPHNSIASGIAGSVSELDAALFCSVSGVPAHYSGVSLDQSELTFAQAPLVSDPPERHFSWITTMTGSSSPEGVTPAQNAGLNTMHGRPSTGEASSMQESSSIPVTASAGSTAPNQYTGPSRADNSTSSSQKRGKDRSDGSKKRVSRNTKSNQAPQIFKCVYADCERVFMRK